MQGPAIQQGGQSLHSIRFDPGHILWPDVKIIAPGIRPIVRRDGISAAGSAAMETFEG